jgi:hypothetical protein
MQKSEVNARNILLEVLNDMLWQMEQNPHRFASHSITPMLSFYVANPVAYHEAIGYLQALVDQLETEANREPESNPSSNQE